MLHLDLTRARLTVGAIAALAALLAAQPAAEAQKKEPAPKGAPSSDELARGKEHFAQGKKLFDKKNYKGAVLEFKESYRLTRNPLLLYNIGYTFDQLGERKLAVFYYRKYLELAPDADPNRQPAEGRIQVLELEIEEEAVLGGQPASGLTTGKQPKAEPEAPAEEPAAPAVKKLEHAVIDEAPPGRPIDVSAAVPGGRGWTVALFYRAAGEASFTRVDMRPRLGELVGRIPAGKATGASVQYYLEARDAGGKVVGRSGRQTSPHLVLLDRAARPRFHADLGDERAEPVAAGETAAAGGGVLAAEEGGGGDGWMDAGSSRFGKLKWGTTVAAGGLLALSTTFYLLSAKASSDLEAEATLSVDPAECGGAPPCRTFSDDQQALEGRGQRFETFANISLGIGAAAAIGAGVLWYLDGRDTRKRRRERNRSRPGQLEGDDDAPDLSAAPVIGEDFVGGAAAVRF